MACIYNHLSLTDTISQLELLFRFSRHLLRGSHPSSQKSLIERDKIENDQLLSAYSLSLWFCLSW